MKIRDATFADVRHVAQFMRPRDVEEFLAVSPVATKDELVSALVDRFGLRNDLIAATFEHEPVAIGGLIEHRPNVATLLFFATPNFRHVAFGLTRFIKQRLFPRIQAAGVHRIEAVSLSTYEEAHRWIEVLGLEREAELKGYGKNGETYIQFAWVRDA